MNELVELNSITSRIYTIRAVKVMLDRGLAELYEVPTKTLKQSVKRHIKRFPSEFMFELSYQEFKDLRPQIVTSNPKAAMNKQDLIAQLRRPNGLSTVESKMVRSDFAEQSPPPWSRQKFQNW
jgi:hypothetical protein